MAALEKKRTRTEELPFEPISLDKSERFLADVLCALEAKEKVEDALTTAERLARRRKGLEGRDAKPVFTDARFGLMCEFRHTAHPRDLLRAISQLEGQLLNEQENRVRGGSHNG